MANGEQTCPIPLALPVVFVPGIMGSRLQNAQGEVVWDPGPTQAIQWVTSIQSVDYVRVPGTVGGVPVFQTDSMTPARRKQIMVGDTFSPNYLRAADDDGQLPSHYTGDSKTKALARGYGGLAWEFYGEFMEWLENSLRDEMDDFPPSCDNIHIEAFAHPYNWTASNEDAGKSLVGYINDFVLPEVNRIYAGQEIEILDPIVISHSMGGLVTRSFAKLDGGEAMVHGIIHGAMPTHGSPAAYKRMRAGFEPGSFVNAARASVAEDMDTRDRESQNAIVRFFNDSYEGWRAIGSGAGARLAGSVSMRYLGATAEEVTALLANMPGGLQLLPNQFHQGPDGDRQWLKITYSSTGDIASLPSGDPYAEIYGRQDKWWRLTNPDMIDPGRSSAAAWAGFVTRLAEVRDWNQRMNDAGGYHANTKMFWGGASFQTCFATVEWKADDEADGLRNRMAAGTVADADDTTGTVAFLLPRTWQRNGATRSYTTTATASIQPGTDPGDGTVHTGSGLRVPSSIESELTVNSRGVPSGYTHDGAYNDTYARRQVAKWVSDMVLFQLDERGFG